MYMLRKTTKFAKFVVALGIQPLEETEEALIFKSKRRLDALISELESELSKTEKGAKQFVDCWISAGWCLESLARRLDTEIAQCDEKNKRLRKKIAENTAKLKAMKLFEKMYNQDLKPSRGPTTKSVINPAPKPVPVEPSKDLPYDYGKYCEAIGNYEEAYKYYRKAARNRAKIAMERLDRASFNRRDPLHEYAKGGWY